MYEEHRLISIGFPLSEAIGICHYLRKEGTLEKFVEEKEKEYRKLCEETVLEVMD